MEVALYQPDIAPNLGAALRLCACLGVRLHVIEPCGFPLDDRRIRRAGLDYIDSADWRRHASWEAFREFARGRRLVLLTTKAQMKYLDFAFREDDILLLGRESAGVPPEVAGTADAALRIPLVPGLRSLNVVQAAAMALGEALRQTRNLQ